MRSLRALGLATLLSVLTVTSPVAAQTADDPADSVPPAQDDLREEGVPPEDDSIVGTPISWSIVPSTAEGTPAEGVSFRLEAEPGETVTRQVLITNHSDVPVVFEIAGSDGVISPEGAFDVLPPGEESTDVGAWIEIPALVEAGPGASVLVPFTITIPNSATPGDHPGGIVAGVSSASAGADGPQVGLMSRVGVRVHLRVAGDIDPAVAITDVDVSYDTSLNPFAPGRLNITYTVTNTGNVRLSSTQQAEIAALFGLPTGARTGPGGVVGEQREILPGQTSTVSAEIDGVWPLGRVTAEIIAVQQAAGADLPLEGLERASTVAAVWAIPWGQLLIVLLVVAAVFVWRRRRRSQRIKVEQLVAEARAAGEREAAASALTAVPADVSVPEEPAELEVLSESDVPSDSSVSSEL